MAIEQLGESLLSQARDRNKKSKKKAKLFTGLMLGVQAGNAILRRQAEKRANEFWKSNFVVCIYFFINNSCIDKP